MSEGQDPEEGGMVKRSRDDFGETASAGAYNEHCQQVMGNAHRTSTLCNCFAGAGKTKYVMLAACCLPWDCA